MKSNKLLIALALCAAMQPGMSFGSEALQTQEPQSPSLFKRYAPQRMQDLSGYLSKQATSAYDTVNSWSTKKKLIVAGTLLTALAAVYNREQIIGWVSDLLQPSVMREFKEEYKKQILAFRNYKNFSDSDSPERAAAFDKVLQGSENLAAIEKQAIEAGISLDVLDEIKRNLRHNM